MEGKATGANEEIEGISCMFQACFGGGWTMRLDEEMAGDSSKVKYFIYHPCTLSVVPCQRINMDHMYYYDLYAEVHNNLVSRRIQIIRFLFLPQ